jgi:hypothetical protein
LDQHQTENHQSHLKVNKKRKQMESMIILTSVCYFSFIATSQTSSPTSSPPKTPTTQLPANGPPRTIKSDEMVFSTTGNTPRDKTIELMYNSLALGSFAGTVCQGNVYIYIIDD